MFFGASGVKKKEKKDEYVENNSIPMLNTVQNTCKPCSSAWLHKLLKISGSFKQRSGSIC